MDETLRTYWESLAASLEALEAARKALATDAKNAVESIRRIARSLCGSGLTAVFPEILQLAGPLDVAKPDEIPTYLEALVHLLRQLTASSPGERHRILIIDDDRIATKLLKNALDTADREILTAESGTRAEKILDEEEVSLIILDVILPDTDGRNLLLRLRERPRTAAVPILVASGLSGTQPKSECFALGADDYFEKPFDPEFVATVVSNRLKRAAEFTRELRRDALTGVLNRAALHEAFQRGQQMASRKGDPLSLAVLDLDTFKTINDVYGHVTGDEVLRHVARKLTGTLRQTDLIARWGGDEFVVLFPGTNERGAARALNNALTAFREQPFRMPDGRSFQITFSAGVVEVNPGEEIDESIAAADRYLYFAKASGRERVFTADDTVAPVNKRILIADDGVTLASIMKHILSREGFDVVHVADGASALTTVPASAVSLVLLDVTMPVMDGFEVLKRLRAMPSCARIPIVMITAMGSRAHILRAMELGANDYLLKPFTPTELLTRVRRLLV